MYILNAKKDINKCIDNVINDILIQKFSILLIRSQIIFR
jgi:hypothetical protein